MPPGHRALVQQLLAAEKSLQAPSSFSGISTADTGDGIWGKQKPWARQGTIPGRCLALRINALGFSVEIPVLWIVNSPRLPTGPASGKELRMEKLLVWSLPSQRKVL